MLVVGVGIDVDQDIIVTSTFQMGASREKS